MPSFFETMRRIVAGKPIFDAPTPHNASPQHGARHEQPSIIKGDARSYPIAYIRRTATQIHGGKMRVSCSIANEWPAPIMLDKIRLLGGVKELDTVLGPHEEKEFEVYEGPVMMRQGESQALLHYKTMQEGDYFETLHDVTFKYHPDKTYSIAELRFHPPVRDIYG